MDILQHAWGQIGLIILIQLLYLEISTGDCFSWHSPSQDRSLTVPAATHIISQRWHQSVPKWYPYNLWKRRKRNKSGSRAFSGDISNAKGRQTLDGKFGDVVSKYKKLLDKLSRKNHMNSILRNDKWKNEGQSTLFGTSVNPPQNSPVASTAKALETKEYRSRKHKSHFGSVVEGSFSSLKSDDGSVSEEKKKVASKDSGFSDDGFGKMLPGGFGTEDGFNPTKESDGFSGDFLSTSPVRSGVSQNEADTAAKTSTGFGSGQFVSDGGSWGDSSWSDSGSWGGDGFGAVDVGPTDSGSWGDVPQESGSFTSTGGGSFSDDAKDCDTISTKSCADNSECSCYGFYTCSNQRCEQLQSSPTGTSSPSMGGWLEGPANFGFSKRKDPRKVIQIFMLPWQQQK